jgi:hypothetical protein
MTWKEFLAQKDSYIGRKITCDEMVVFSTTGMVTNISVEGNAVIMNYQRDDSSIGRFSANMNYFVVAFDKRTGQTVIQPTSPALLMTFRIERKK